MRGGDLVDEAEYPQRCEFDRDPDLYFNAGPARIPGHHATLLGYCKELGVSLAPFVNENRNAWVQDDAMFGGRPVRNREYIADSRGFVAELLAKTVRPESFGTAFDNRDYQQLLEYLRQFGELDGRFKYVSSSRAGYATHDYTNPPAFKQPLNASELLRSGFIYLMSFSELDDQSAMMMEPVGGMDRIVTAFMSKVGHRGEAELAGGIHSARRFRRRCSLSPCGGRTVDAHADFCLSCIPMHLLARIEHNFPKPYAEALGAVPHGKLFKIGLQMKQRFWENEGIYGGISWTLQDIMQLWYPAHGIHRQKGVMLGAYTFNDDVAEKFADLPPAQRTALAIQQGEKIHPATVATWKTASASPGIA